MTYADNKKVTNLIQIQFDLAYTNKDIKSMKVLSELIKEVHKNRLIMKYKQEVLDRISILQLDSGDFEHQLEDSNRTSASYQVSIESLHYEITLEIIETVIWSDYDWYEFEDLEIGFFSVLDLDDNEFESNFTEEEIINHINY